ncbi:unnamed protein product [Pseudo-nitzschia multistriata]|uniref:Peptidyl-prolyl cis-trans isomerase n=1 Tax=Pseudo-nitzschia multistriata TaxID=183589 RepID=A0A448Z3Z8_9STRA|nr:unnamed protein product [Pseudo-nitzschia multistriata]
MAFFSQISSLATILLASWLLFVAPPTAEAFLPTAPRTASATQTSSTLGMGLFDGIAKAFSNEEYGPPPDKVRATARHILVESEGEAKVIMKMISSGEKTFQDCAREFSTCPSANQGGSLGSFSPGTMVPEFDKAIFNPDTRVGDMVGPVLTNFGHHIIVVEKRTGGGDWY